MNVPQCVFYIGTDSFETEYSHSFWLALATGKHMNLQIDFARFALELIIPSPTVTNSDDFQASCAPSLGFLW